MKNEIRKELKKIRNEITNKDNKSNIICDKLFDLLNDLEVIGLYASMKNEVNLDNLINSLLQRGKCVCLPRVEGNIINFYKINSLADLEINNKIREPKPISLINPNSIEALVIPGLGFDIHNNRIGYGKGYYDRYLCGYNNKKIGVCFKEQLLDNIPTNCNDIKMNIIITD